ncbi:Alpha/Beta hydrolase protein [Cercophora newfieldiana]|uniref:Alpha/Beta hydrolase protein n=1 Tax=Cercophora newfieldiana TaxID=92897 RepID=A0AA40CMK8_9PEZI|nr:Alpha/Beta hydrolase protein [Cercophora newfieldiana]
MSSSSKMEAPPASMKTENATSPGSSFVTYAHTIAFTPFILTRFGFDVACCLLPSTRPSKEHSFEQAVRLRFLKLVLLYCSILRAGPKLTLRSGREGNRFEVIRPQSQEVYQGPLSDNEIRPEPIGITWTPEPPSDVSTGSEPIVVVHIHGGAFVVGDGRDSDTGFLAKTLIRRMGCTHVCTPQYRLSGDKEGRFPAALQDALTAYLHLIKEKGILAKQIILSGDSAGANIALGLLRYIHEHGKELDIPAPRAVALWSPWVDVAAAVKGDLRDYPNYSTDYLTKEFGQWGAHAVSGYGAIDLDGPYLSPAHHPFKMEADVPMFVQGGDKELIWESIEIMASGFKEVGWSNIKLKVSENCPHDILLVGPVVGFREEAKVAATEAREFFLATTDLKLV